MTDLTKQAFYWSIRRELWENRFLYLAPLIVAAIVTFTSAIAVVASAFRYPGVSDALTLNRVLQPLRMAPAPIMLTALVIGFFYSLDALYGERRDRSLLFWKSLPVSDTTTVLTKASIPLVVLPAIALGLSFGTQLVLTPLTGAVMASKGISVAHLGSLERMATMVYGLSAHALWFAPIYALALLVSAWAPRAPLMWTVMPFVVAGAVEHVTFRTKLVPSFLKYRLGGAMREAFGNPNGTDHLRDLTPLRFLGSSGLWLGLIFAAACIALSVKLRHSRDPS